MDLSIFKRQTTRLQLIGFDQSVIKLSFELQYQWSEVSSILDTRDLYHVILEIEYKNFDNAVEKRKFNYLDSYGRYPDLHIIGAMVYSPIMREAYSCIRKRGGLGLLTISQLI